MATTTASTIDSSHLSQGVATSSWRRRRLLAVPPNVSYDIHSLLWKRNKPPLNLTRYNLTTFAITLNELTPGLQERLPPTDSRLRPDQRHLENGEYEKANAEKQRLERRQRMSRKLQEHGWKPRWFQKEGENGSFRYGGGYWEAREQGNWDGCPNIFGEFNEDLVESSEGP
nr:oxysterol-binding protein-related protein 2A-like [Populus alba]